ncbi:radical SAM enzyme [Zopfia rhizophila CBS 207.26]|uniref:Radical SAM enzyme n=1 Tax=Zopfia rhizophila CBS 207.26 TaxID=1314779 RepID=A0A6A6DA76_9PEZI|nr:radical SAM enzyme [Zopfia rhizophila CBS 207.26]
MSSIYRRDSVIVVVRPVDERCNLSCEYCNAAVHANSRAIMSRETLERIIVQASKPDYRFVQFVWHGGEPLLAGLDFYKAVLELQQQHFGGNFAAGRCENVIQTNGLLLSTNTLDFLEKGGFWIGTSIDGPDLSANRYRFQGRGAETVLKKTLDACRSVRARGLSLLTISVIHDANFYRAEEMYHFFCKLDDILAAQIRRSCGCFVKAFLEGLGLGVRNIQ